jgi:general stress protein 26
MAKSDKQFIKDYLHGQKICVLATTAQDGQPEVAAMAFTETQDLEIIFQTPQASRKYVNLKARPYIAIVVGWELTTFDTVQYEGVARELTDEAEIDKYRQIHLAKNPYSKRYAYLAGNSFFVVTPTWVRYTDFKSDPPNEIVLKF